MIEEIENDNLRTTEATNDNELHIETKWTTAMGTTNEEDDEIEEGQLYEHWKIEVDPGQTSVRIDKFLAEKNPYQSRNRIQAAADAGCIFVNGSPVKSNYKIRPNDVITLMLNRPKHDTSIVAEDIPPPPHHSSRQSLRAR